MNAISIRSFWPRGRNLSYPRSEAAKPAATADLQTGEATAGEKNVAKSTILDLAANSPHVIAATLFSRQPK